MLHIYQELALCLIDSSRKDADDLDARAYAHGDCEDFFFEYRYGELEDDWPTYPAHPPKGIS